MSSIILPGTKLLIYLISVITIVSIDELDFIIFSGLIALLIIIFTGRAKKLLKMFILTIPFLITAVIIGFISQDNNGAFTGILIFKLLTIVMLNTIILNNFDEISLLKAMKQLHFPHIFTSIAFFVFSYRKILSEEIYRLKIARRLRGSNSDKKWFTLKEYRNQGQIIGAGLIRSLRRGDTVFNAMTLRGLHTKNLTYSDHSIKDDWIIIIIIISIIIAIVILLNFRR